MRAKFYGPNGIEVNFEEFARLLAESGRKDPIVVTMKKRKPRKKRRSKRG